MNDLFIQRRAMDVAKPTACVIEEKLVELVHHPRRHEILTLMVHEAILAFVEFGEFKVPDPSVN